MLSRDVLQDGRWWHWRELIDRWMTFPEDWIWPELSLVVSVHGIAPSLPLELGLIVKPSRIWESRGPACSANGVRVLETAFYELSSR